MQEMTLISIFWPGGGNGGRAPLGCPYASSFSILSLTCIHYQARWTWHVKPAHPLCTMTGILLVAGAVVDLSWSDW